MPAPTFVNAGTSLTQNFGTSITPPLPASLVNGNLLLVVVSNGATAGKVFTFPGDWNVIESFAGPSSGSAVAWRYVDGAETAPAITWSGNTSAQARVFQYSGVDATDPIGTVHKNQLASASVTVTEAGVVVERNNSLVAVMICGHSTGTTMSTPSGYTLDAHSAGSNGTISAFSQSTPADLAGESSDAVSATAGTSSTWMAYSIEIGSEAPPIPPVNLAAAFVDEALLDAVLTVSDDRLLVAALVDEALLDAVLTVTPNLQLSCAMTDGAILDVRVSEKIFTAPPVQTIVIVNS